MGIVAGPRTADAEFSPLQIRHTVDAVIIRDQHLQASGVQDGNRPHAVIGFLKALRASGVGRQTVGAVDHSEVQFSSLHQQAILGPAGRRLRYEVPEPVVCKILGQDV